MFLGIALSGKAQSKIDDIAGLWTSTKRVQQGPDDSGKPKVTTETYKAGEEYWNIKMSGKVTHRLKGAPLRTGFYIYGEEGKLYLAHEDDQANELYLIKLEKDSLLLYNMAIHDFDDPKGYKNIKYLKRGE